jgi:hypothetical protein
MKNFAAWLPFPGFSTGNGLIALDQIADAGIFEIFYFHAHLLPGCGLADTVLFNMQ